MKCREGCGACCIAPSIKLPYYGMPAGKPAGVRCVHLDKDLQCELLGDSRRPAVCAEFAAEKEICGADREEALARLLWLETASEPN